MHIHCTTKECVLVLAGIELFFFLVAGTVLCFGFSMRNVSVMFQSLVSNGYPKLRTF